MQTYLTNLNDNEKEWVYNDEIIHLHQELKPNINIELDKIIQLPLEIKILHYNKVSEKKTTCNIEIQCGYKNIVSFLYFVTQKFVLYF